MATTFQKRSLLLAPVGFGNMPHPSAARDQEAKLPKQEFPRQ